MCEIDGPFRMRDRSSNGQIAHHDLEQPCHCTGRIIRTTPQYRHSGSRIKDIGFHGFEHLREYRHGVVSLLAGQRLEESGDGPRPTLPIHPGISPVQ